MISRTLVYSTALIALAAACTEYEIKPAETEAFEPLDTAEPIIEDTAEPEPEPVEEEPEPEVEIPVAVCDVTPNPVTPPFEEAQWIGSDSYDPDGGSIVSYEWTLVEQPSGSAVGMPAGGAVRTPFQPDLAGDYIGELVVFNDSGVASEPCEVTLESIPAENLWVEMYWDQSGDDMDLHLLAPGGAIEERTDCYYANCVDGGGGLGGLFGGGGGSSSLDWGVSGYDGDDPSIDLDDIPGMGPENINILDPEDSVYTVIVHDYPGSRFEGANNVTINIYLNGSLAWSDTRAISGEDSYTTYATIDWAAGTVTSM